jgi:hypothetical protein
MAVMSTFPTEARNRILVKIFIKFARCFARASVSLSPRRSQTVGPPSIGAAPASASYVEMIIEGFGNPWRSSGVGF